MTIADADISSVDLDGIFSEERSAPGELILDVRGVAVRFGGVHALMDMTFEVHQGDLVAMIGPNGAGKTTLLNTIFGLSSSMTGRIEFKGQDITSWTPSTIAAAGVGRSFQHPPLLEHETVLENVIVGMHHKIRYGLPTQVFRPRKVARVEHELRNRAHLLLSVVGLDRLADVPVSGQSYGKRKLIDIARSMAAGPELLLLDEPTSGLDALEQAKVRDLLLRLRATGRVTIIIVEHHMDLVRAVATKVLGLQAGSVLAVGSPQEVLESEEFRLAVVGSNDRSVATETVRRDT